MTWSSWSTRRWNAIDGKWGAFKKFFNRGPTCDESKLKKETGRWFCGTEQKSWSWNWTANRCESIQVWKRIDEWSIQERQRCHFDIHKTWILTRTDMDIGQKLTFVLKWMLCANFILTCRYRSLAVLDGFLFLTKCFFLVGFIASRDGQALISLDKFVLLTKTSFQSSVFASVDGQLLKFQTYWTDK